MSQEDQNSVAFPTEHEWPQCGLTKLQWAAVTIAAGISRRLSNDHDFADVDAQKIARDATRIAVAVLEATLP